MCHSLAVTKVKRVCELQHPLSGIHGCSSTANANCHVVEFDAASQWDPPVLRCGVQKVPQVTQADLLVQLKVVFSAAVPKHLCDVGVHSSQLHSLQKGRLWNAEIEARKSSGVQNLHQLQNCGALHSPHNTQTKRLYEQFWECLFSRTARLAMR